MHKRESEIQVCLCVVFKGRERLYGCVLKKEGEREGETECEFSLRIV